MDHRISEVEIQCLEAVLKFSYCCWPHGALICWNVPKAAPPVSVWRGIDSLLTIQDSIEPKIKRGANGKICRGKKNFRGMGRHIRFRNEVIACIKKHTHRYREKFIEEYKNRYKKQSCQWQKDKGRKMGCSLNKQVTFREGGRRWRWDDRWNWLTKVQDYMKELQLIQTWARSFSCTEWNAFSCSRK